MKLIDMLVEELPKRGGWRHDVKTMTQDKWKDIWGYNCCQPWLKYSGWWVSKSGADLVNNSKIEVTELAIDWQTAIITREQYEAALAAKNDGWIEWGGGVIHISTNTFVDIKFNNGDVRLGKIAGEYSWEHAWEDSNIIAYRLHQPKEAEHSEESEEDLNECIGQDAAQVWGGEGKPAIGTKCEHHSGGQWEVVTIAGIYENLVTGFTDYWMVKEDGSSYTVGNPYRFRPIRSEADKRREEAVQALCDAGGGNGKVDEKAGYGSCWFDVYDAIAAGKIPGVKLED